MHQKKDLFTDCFSGSMAMDMRRLVALLFGSLFLCSSASDVSSESNLPTGAFLQIDLMKRNTSELSRTTLKEPSIAAFRGAAPYPSVDGIVGELVPWAPLDGCRPLEFNPLFHSNTTLGLAFKSMVNSTNFVVLMRKGRCSYKEMFERAAKIQHVVGIMIYDTDADYNSDLNLSSFQDLVPGLLISSFLGEDLLKRVLKYRDWAASPESAPDDNPWVQITIKYTPIKMNVARAMQIILIGVGLALILSMILSVAWNYKSRTEQASGNDSLQPPPRRRPEEIPIDDEFILKIPKRSYRSPNSSPVDIVIKGKTSQENLLPNSDDEEEDYRQKHPHNETCPVCLDEFMYGTEINQLHCGHCYHPKCIIPWLQSRSPVCPLCKIDVRVSMIEAEELAFVRSLRRLKRRKSSSAPNGEALISNMIENTDHTSEMREVCVVMSRASSVRARNASFDSIPLEAAESTFHPTTGRPITNQSTV